MKLLELFEARRNPEQNPKPSINQIIADRLNATNSTIAGVPNMFVSFTSINKLGINPGSKYDTPAGIYAYPANYVVDMTGDTDSMASLPFAGDLPYVTTFSTSGNVINVATMGLAEANKYHGKLARYWAKVDGISEDESHNIIDDYIKRAQREATFPDYPGGVFWYVTMMVAKELLAPRTGSAVPVAWNKLFRSIGIDGAVDLDPGSIEGVGIIHTNEPSQAVFFSRATITKEQRHENKYTPTARDKLRRSEGQSKHARMVAASADVHNVSDYATAVEFIRKHGDWAVRLIKDNEIRTALITKMPFLIGALSNAPRDLQITALTTDPMVLKLIKRPDQSVISRLLANGEIGNLTIQDIVNSVIQGSDKTISEPLQHALVRYDDQAVRLIPNPARSTVELAVELASKQYHRLAGNNIPEDIAILALKHRVPYIWYMDTYHKRLKEQEVAAKAQIANLSLALARADSDYEDLSSKHPDQQQALKLRTATYKQSIQKQIDEVQEKISKNITPMLARLDHLYKHSENGKRGE